MLQAMVGVRAIPDTTVRPLPGALESLSTLASPLEQPVPPRTCPLATGLLQTTPPGASQECRPLASRTKGWQKEGER